MTVYDLMAERDRLAAENQRLREALRPFAEYAASIDADHSAAGIPDSASIGYLPGFDRFPLRPTLGHCRRAKEVLDG